MNPFEMKVAANYHCETGENPLGNPVDGRIYWTDIPRGRIYKYNPGTEKHEEIYRGKPVGGFTIQEDGRLLLFMSKGQIALLNSDGSLETIQPFLPGEEESRFNDVIADPEGKVYCGTMPTPDRKGKLYLLDTDGSVSVVEEGIDCSNGMGFSPDLTRMYHVDSGKRKIYVYEYHKSKVINRKIFIETDPDYGVPDGMTIDTEGFLWVAHWNGSAVVRYSPAGKEVQKFDVPAAKVSCVTFAPPDFQILYITTAGGTIGSETLDGALFYCKPGFKGKPEFFSKIKTKI